MSFSHDEILNTAIPGIEYTPSPRSQVVRSLIEKPRKYWRSQDQIWAVYAIAGNRLGETIIESVQQAKLLGLIPLLIVRDNVELAAVAEHYTDLQCHVACPIAGTPSLIPPVNSPRRRVRRQISSTRIPQDLLTELAENTPFPRPLKNALNDLLGAYRRIRRNGGNNDTSEHTALSSFMNTMLRQIGFRSTSTCAPDMIRQIELAGWGGDRDHFFHSFQNFFFGLYAISRLAPHFREYRRIARLDWDLNSYHVWFLAALRHDVGYGVAHLEEIHYDVLGPELAENSAESSRAVFLKSDLVKEGLLKICTLMARLLKPENIRTGYMVPDRWPNRNPQVKAIRHAFEESVIDHGHGAASALRLYRDLVPAARRLGAARQDIVTQVVQLACVSLPFHDVNFRDHLRILIGPFSISTTVMPFASLLAFIDSIQDDRRDLAALREEVRYLERILVQEPATIKAELNTQSISDHSLLWKVVEARDVIAHLSQNPVSLYFQYPEWMV
jgi:hypothetical protein